MLRRADLERFNREVQWRRYRDDAELFFREAIWVPSQRADDGREKLELFDYQAEDFATLRDNKFVIGLKARQIGWSTIIAASLLHRCLFKPGTVGLWVSNNQENADKAIGMLNLMWNFLPRWVRARAPELTADQASRKEWTFPDGMTSRIRALAGTATAGASETASIAVLDEFGLVDGATQEDLYRSVEPTTDAGGQLWILSTARGAHNRFAKMARAALKRMSNYAAMFRPWMVSRFVNPLAEAPGRDTCPMCTSAPYGYHPDCPDHVDRSIIETKRRQFRDQPWKIHAEYPETPEEAFRESGNPRYSGLPNEEDTYDGWVRGNMKAATESDVSLGKARLVGDPLFEMDELGPLRVHPDIAEAGPEDFRRYVLFVDPAKGLGGDFTAMHVLTLDDDGLPDIAAFWHHNRTEPIDVAHQADLLGRWFHGTDSAALLAVENTGGWGDLIIHELYVNLHYPHMYRHIPATAGRRKRQARLGFPMNVGTRPAVVDRLADYLRDDQVIGHIHPLLRDELVTFVVTETGKIQADVGCYDDLVMSCAGGVWVLTENVRATGRPPVEKPVEGDPKPKNNLMAMFDRIEAARAAEEVAAAKSLRRRGRLFDRTRT